MSRSCQAPIRKEPSRGTPSTPRLAGSLVLDVEPEGYADVHRVFYTNLGDKDRTLQIDLKTRRVDNIDYLPASRSVYVASGRAGIPTKLRIRGEAPAVLCENPVC